MPRFYFNVMDGMDYDDCDGIELPDVAAAQTMAVRYVADLLHENGRRFLTLGFLSLSVTDEESRTLFDVSLVARRTVHDQRRRLAIG